MKTYLHLINAAFRHRLGCACDFVSKTTYLRCFFFKKNMPANCVLVRPAFHSQSNKKQYLLPEF